MTNLNDDEDDVADLEADQDKDPKVQEHKNLKQKGAKSVISEFHFSRPNKPFRLTRFEVANTVRRFVEWFRWSRS